MNYIKKATNNLKQTLNLPGFRKNKIPEAIFNQHVSRTQILKAAHRQALRDAYDFASQQSTDAKPIANPTINVKTISESKYVLDIIFDTMGDWVIKTYKNITNIKKPKITVSLDEVQTRVNETLLRYATFRDSSDPTTMGDMVTIDFQGFINKKPFANGSGKDHRLLLGSKQFIGTFEEQLVGVKAGDKIDVKVTFPKDYFQQQLAQQKATFKVIVHKIEHVNLPKLDKALFKLLQLPTDMTAPKFRTSIKKEITQSKQKEFRTDYLDELCEEIAHRSELKVPRAMIERETQRLYKEFHDELDRRNLKLNQYKKKSKIDDDKIKEYLEEDAENRVHKSIIFDQIAKLEKLIPTPDQINTEYKKISQQYNLPETEIRKIFEPERLSQQLKSDLVANFLFENNG